MPNEAHAVKAQCGNCANLLIWQKFRESNILTIDITVFTELLETFFFLMRVFSFFHTGKDAK